MIKILLFFRVKNNIVVFFSERGEPLRDEPGRPIPWGGAGSEALKVQILLNALCLYSFVSVFVFICVYICWFCYALSHVSIDESIPVNFLIC